MLTKSGTNSFRGTGYDFYRTDKLATNTFDNKANDIEKGEFKRHQLGFSIGGPIRRDKMHFFSNLEYIRVRSADTLISWVPTPQFIAASAQPTRDFFAAYGGGVDDQRHRADPRRRVGRSSTRPAPARSSRCRPTCRCSPASRSRCRSTPAAAIRRTTTSGSSRWTSRISNNTQMYVRYAYAGSGSRSRARNSASPYAGFDTGYVEQEPQHPGLADARLRLDASRRRPRSSWNRLLGDQPLNGDFQPTLYMNPTTPVALQGYNIAFPGLPAVQPGQRHSVRRTAEAAAVLSGPDLDHAASTTSASAARTCTSRTTARSARTRTRSRR